jgi:hypothetical protein
MDTIAAAVRDFYDLPDPIDRHLDSVVEVDVRLTFSHMLQPMGTIDDAAQQIYTTVRGLLDAATAQGG